MKHFSNLAFLILLIVLPLGCTFIAPMAVPNRTETEPRTFSHEGFDKVLQRFVNDRGEVDYAALKKDVQELDRYYLLLAAYSPDSHPHLFPSEQSALAYWINAYNAVAIKIVLTYYPILSVEDVKAPWLFFFLPKKSGFFLFQRVSLGGKVTSLYAIENQIIRKRFPDPRIHFALNCASHGCPRLPRRAFTAENLDSELDRETRLFLAENRNFTIDDQEGIAYLSSIFDWYQKDFLSWYQTRFPSKRATLLNYVMLYLSHPKAEKVKRVPPYQIRFIPYDWQLNDQAASS